MNDKDTVVVPRATFDRIRRSMALLQQNSEGCAQNHYGGDFYLHGIPGWLVDTRADLEAMTALAAAPSTSVREEVERLRAALKPFADAAEGWEGNPDEDALIEEGEGQDLTVRDLRRARATLKPSTDKGGEE